MEYAIHLFNAGGVVMYPLVLFMLAACTILFERIRMYRRIDSEIQQLSSSIEAGRNANDWIAGGDIGAPTVITGGVSEALIATATGLSVAIVALAIHSWCTSKVNYDIAKLEQRLGSILDLYIRSQR
ncbi:MAG: MotA/TolQ/ExbB proton channel family protein [Veillonella sp.]|uniref:MotA/TolQ/ExbB proton channel family protein n=1 Tax=Veillonella sp. TaxID=1926307 RepID=UPI00257F34C6|nr:MotA/TolQ/ExbB proton channel family protein [Veillonella sp.]MBS6893000.1 MotA/TolQ/ExbB proton channel family protein [Veillonella sp.]